MVDDDNIGRSDNCYDDRASKSDLNPRRLLWHSLSDPLAISTAFDSGIS